MPWTAGEGVRSLDFLFDVLSGFSGNRHVVLIADIAAGAAAQGHNAQGEAPAERQVRRPAKMIRKKMSDTRTRDGAGARRSLAHDA